MRVINVRYSYFYVGKLYAVLFELNADASKCVFYMGCADSWKGT